MRSRRNQPGEEGRASREAGGDPRGVLEANEERVSTVLDTAASSDTTRPTD